MDEEKADGILPSLQKLLDKNAQRQKRQREYYAEKGKVVRRNYYLANIEEKRRASREYARKKREQFKKYERARSAFVNTFFHTPTPPPRKEHYDRNRLKQI